MSKAIGLALHRGFGLKQGRVCRVPLQGCFELDTNRPRLLAFGTDDEFMHEIGSQEYARAKNGLTADNISAKVLQVLRINGGR